MLRYLLPGFIPIPPKVDSLGPKICLLSPSRVQCSMRQGVLIGEVLGVDYYPGDYGKSGRYIGMLPEAVYPVLHESQASHLNRAYPGFKNVDPQHPYFQYIKQFQDVIRALNKAIPVDGEILALIHGLLP